MSKRQTVLKDFSDLKIQKRIELSAIGIYQLVFRGEMERAFEPKKGTEIHRVYKMKKLALRQQRAWKMFRRDVDEAAGKSGAVTAGYGEYHDKGEHIPLPRAYTNDAWGRVQYIFETYLGRRERALLWDLLQNDIKSSTDLKLEFIGLMRSGYSGENEARIAGVVHVQSLLDRLADLYQV